LPCQLALIYTKFLSFWSKIPGAGCSSSRFVVVSDYSHLSHCTPVTSRLPPPSDVQQENWNQKRTCSRCRHARHLASTRSFGRFYLVLGEWEPVGRILCCFVLKHAASRASSTPPVNVHFVFGPHSADHVFK
jgi:hypothetical protein